MSCHNATEAANIAAFLFRPAEAISSLCMIGAYPGGFPWPNEPSENQRQSIETAAQAVLDARANHPGASLADRYDPLTMPPDLVKAHQRRGAAVDVLYSKKKYSGDADRVAFLFERYQQLLAQGR